MGVMVQHVSVPRHIDPGCARPASMARQNEEGVR